MTVNITSQKVLNESITANTHLHKQTLGSKMTFCRLKNIFTNREGDVTNPSAAILQTQPSIGHQSLIL